VKQGGTLKPGDNPPRLEDRLAEFLEELRSRYTIGYHPSESKPPATELLTKVNL
jgi:hypothetical protein